MAGILIWRTYSNVYIVLTCYIRRYLAAICVQMVHAAYLLHHSRQDSISAYNRSIPKKNTHNGLHKTTFEHRAQYMSVYDFHTCDKTQYHR